MVILEKIILNNFLSHKKTELNFKINQQILLDGLSGSGKSSIVEGLVWCLYGKARSDNKSLIKRGEEKANVITELIDVEKKTTYKIERKITAKKHELKLYEKVDNAEKFTPVKTSGVKETQDFLENEILHSSYLLFINSIVYPQNNTENFVMQTAAKKKDILLEIIKAYDYDGYLKKAKERIQDNKTKLEVLDANVINLKNKITDDREKSKDIATLKELEESLTKQKSNEDIKYSLLIKESGHIKSSIGSLDTIKQMLSRTTILIQNNDNKTILLEKETEELKAIDINEIQDKVNILNSKKLELQALEAVQAKYYDWNEKMSTLIRLSPIEHDYDVDIAEINKQLIEIINEKVEACKKCGTPYPEIEIRKQTRIKALEVILIDKQAGKKELELNKDEHQKKIQNLGIKPIIDNETMTNIKEAVVSLEPFISKLAEVKEKQSKIEKNKNEIDTLRGDNMELIKNENEYKDKLVSYEGLATKENELNIEISKQSEVLQIVSDKKADTSVKLMVASNAKDDLEMSEEKLNKLLKEKDKNRNEADVLSLVKDAFGPTGIKTIMIDILIPQLEDKINSILDKLSDFRIKIETQKSGLGKEVLLEGLFITIINELGEQFGFDSYSGGERVKISMAINEGLASISTINFRILDETVIALDNDSTQKFMEAMSEIQKMVNQIVCVSHIQEIKDIFDEKIYIKKINGTSVIDNK